MALTKEQKERIRINREKALEIQRKRREEKTEETKGNECSDQDILKPSKKQKTGGSSPNMKSKSILDRNTGTDYNHDNNLPLEDFEKGAPDLISKKEAMTMYCLPEGSMAVCSYEEKKNPRNPLFNPMKLYRRSEIRYRAHKRYGGLEGLVKEREKRRKRKLEKDMEEARKIFK
mmetsp:Transcript_7216/g.17595  ORF Transcript_7216/g.17595 Transcript_7216/m.17595 type:complete len:174 (-) Transcript_7216:189-710(-)|eukprot:CAMPEP_0197179356 /NCGR_PEP_ID=MMETSP1423-20130617/4339_1 /TAXON_ID=476441 /ORGANISM="Pseudo-nitzschia heimii, Strain UNC1101" /LENGTH=173 /DNA_ID=CAMNT_0042629259 /DNA_START=326 /DNA_END=847 /DNA_ORIENTATION=-